MTALREPPEEWTDSQKLPSLEVACQQQSESLGFGPRCWSPSQLSLCWLCDYNNLGNLSEPWFSQSALVNAACYMGLGQGTAVLITVSFVPRRQLTLSPHLSNESVEQGYHHQCCRIIVEVK